MPKRSNLPLLETKRIRSQNIYRLIPWPARLTTGLKFCHAQSFVIAKLPTDDATVSPSRRTAAAGLTPLYPRSSGNATDPTAGPELLAEKLVVLVPALRVMVALSLTRAHAKTASSGYSKLRMLPVEAPPLHMAALGWLGRFVSGILGESVGW